MKTDVIVICPAYQGLNLSPAAQAELDELIATAERFIKLRRARVLAQIDAQEQAIVANVRARMDRRRRDLGVQ